MLYSGNRSQSLLITCQPPQIFRRKTSRSVLLIPLPVLQFLFVFIVGHINKCGLNVIYHIYLPELSTE